MPMFDLICDSGHEQIDVMLKVGERPPCPCGAPTSTLWRGKAAAVVGDDIPGGVYIKHGICWPDGSPRKYYSHSEIHKEAAKQGLQHHVEHVAERGSDKSKHTTRWT